MPNDQTYFDGIIAQLQANTIEGVLDLTNRGLNNNDLIRLVTAFTAATKVSILSLSFNQITNVGAKTLATLLASNPLLTQLDLSSNLIGDDGVIAIANALQNFNTHLISLNLNGAALTTDASASAIANMLAANPALITLLLSTTGFTDGGIQLFVTALQKNPVLQFLGLGGSTSLTDKSAKAVAGLLSTDSALTGIAIINSNITDSGAEAFATALQSNPLTYLDLQGNPITGTGAAALIATLQNDYSLTFLNLPATLVSAADLAIINALIARNIAVQAAIAGLKANTLTSLDLSNMQINDAGIVLIAEAMKWNTSLVTLVLTSNQITDIGAEIIVNLLTANATLKNLWLTGNQIKRFGAQAFAGALSSGSSLEMLFLDGNQIDDTGAKALAMALTGKTQLKTLYLFANPFTSIGINAISNMLAINSSLQTIQLCSSNLGDPEAKILTMALRNNTSLKALWISNNLITDTGMQYFADLCSINDSLNTLGILASQFTNAGVSAILNGLQNNYDITTLDLSSSVNISSANQAAITALTNRNIAVQAAIAGLKANTLTSLNLPNMGINDAGIMLIAEAMKDNRSVIYINLQFNSIGPLGAQAISNALQYNRFLNVLALGGNPIGDDGAAWIAMGITNNNSLIQLDLSNTGIGNNGAKAFALAFQTNHALQDINLAANFIADPGAQAIAAALTTDNTSLNEIDLYGNLITDASAPALITAAITNKDITYLRLTANNISTANLNAINAQIYQNSQYLQFGNVFNSSYDSIGSGYNNLQITQGEKFPITPQNIKASSVDSNATVSYTVTTKYGCVVNANNEPITQVSDVDTANNNVFGIPDGSSKPMELVVIATDGTNTTVPHPTAVVFIPQDSAPMLVNNNFTLIDGETTIITPAMLSASFPNVTTPQSGLAFNVKTTGGYLSYIYDNSSTPLTYLTQGSVIEECVGFRGDGSGDKPTIDIQVTDGRANNTNPFIPAVIDYIRLTTTTTETDDFDPTTPEAIETTLTTLRTLSQSITPPSMGNITTPNATSPVASLTSSKPSTSFFPTHRPTISSSHSTNSTALIAGVATAATAFLLLLIATLFKSYRNYAKNTHKVAVVLNPPPVELGMIANAAHPSFRGDSDTDWPEEHYEVGPNTSRRASEAPLAARDTQYGSHFDTIGSRATLFPKEQTQLECYAKVSTDDVTTGFGYNNASEG